MTDKRDPERFPRSTAYVTQPDVREVSAAALLLAYAHLHILELLCGSTRPREAVLSGLRLFIRVLVPAASLRAYPVPPGIVITRDGIFQRHESCLADSAQRVRDALRLQSWHAFPALLDWKPPVTWMAPADLEAVDWLEETLRRVACGGALYWAARGAHDQHLGKPRRRRAPVEPAWLHGQLTATLNHVWFALLHARWDYGHGPLWLHRLLDETQRPTWEPGPAPDPRHRQ